MIDILPLVESDLPSLPSLQPAGWRDIVPSFATYVAEPYCKAIKASLNGETVGIGAGISLGAGEALLSRTGWLAHVIVHHDHRNRGIGWAIVDHLIHLLRANGCIAISLIATQLGHPVYLRAGFREQTEYLFFERNEPSEISPARSMTIEPYRESHREGILILDREVSGEDRAELFARKLGGAMLCVTGGDLVGFLAPEIGEGLLVAVDPDAGLALMRRRLETARRAVLPIDNRAGTAALQGAGYADAGRAFRMVLGEPFSWKPENLYNRIAGNLG